jgi:hypothetical protein
MGDAFIREYIDDVLRSLRTQWILDIIKPYTRIEIAYLARVSLLICSISGDPSLIISRVSFLRYSN